MLHFRWSRSHVALSPWSWWRRRRRRPTGSWRRAGGKASSCSASRRVHPPPCPSTWTPQSAAQRLGAQVTKERKVKYPDEDFPNPEPEPLSSQICVLTSSFPIKTDAYSQINKQLFTPFIFQRWFNSLEVEKKVKVQRNNLVFHWRKQEQKKKISLLKQLWWLELKIQETFLKIKRALETVCLEIFSLMIYFGLLTKSPGTRYTFFVKGKGPGNRNISWGLKGGEQISSLDLLFCKRKKPWHQKYLSFWKEKSLGTRYSYFF